MDKREFLKGSTALAAVTAVRGALAQGANDVTRENWAGTFHYSTDNVLHLATFAEVQKA